MCADIIMIQPEKKKLSKLIFSLVQNLSVTLVGNVCLMPFTFVVICCLVIWYGGRFTLQGATNGVILPIYDMVLSVHGSIA